MVNSFENYLKQGKAKRKTPDFEEAKSLLKKAENRLQYTKAKEINEKNSQFVLEDAYEAIRESAQALMSIKGFKPYSHEATISFVREFYGINFNDEEIHKFDRFRQLRNSSVYTAAEVPIEDAKNSVIFAELFLNKAKFLLESRGNVLKETFGTLKFNKTTQELLDESDKELWPDD